MFGQKPAFGGGAFGGGQASTTSSGTGFGASAFGGGGGAFGGNTGTNLFGGGANTSQPMFGGATNTSTSFGFGNQTGGFGAANKPVGAVSAFGAPSTNTGFGSTAGSSLFGGNTAQPGTSNTLFGGTAAANTSFGNTASTFGAANTSFGGNTSFGATATNTNAPVGTTIKFNPATGTDTMVKSGVNTNINTRHQCITCMKEYEGKSLEELRCEDYLANRKGGGAAGGLFGSQQTNTGGGFFNSNNSTTQSMFNKPMFGATSTTNTPATGFGAFNNNNASNSLFSNSASKPGFGGFGNTATTSTSAFSFGNTNTTNNTSLFGANKPLTFGNQQQGGGSMFGNTATSSAFGSAQPNTGFGAFGATNQPQQQQNLNLFGQNQQQNKPAGGFGNFGGASGGFGTSTTSSNVFGGATNTNFGATNAFNKPSFGFGSNTNTLGFGNNPATSSTGAFGSGQTSSAFSFGNTNPAQSTTSFGNTNSPFGASGSLFGGTTTTTSNAFGSLNQNKPGGLFGGFGGQTNNNLGISTMNNSSTFKSPFGGVANQPFGLNTSQFNSPQLNPLQAQGAVQLTNGSNVLIQQQLLQLASSPYGSNPLFRDVQQQSKEKRKEEPAFAHVLKNKDETASASSIVLSPRRVVNAQRRPVSSQNPQQNRSAFFDGLDDSDIISLESTKKSSDSSDLFVPKSGSIKRLVLKPKKNANEESSPNTFLPSSRKSEGSVANDETLVLNEPRNVLQKKTSKEANEEDSFAVLNTRQSTKSNKDTSRESDKENYAKKMGADKRQDTSSERTSENQPQIVSEDCDDGEEKVGERGRKVVFKLSRPDYYTIPAANELQLDSEGRCLVEDFTICRQGYGNLFFPGVLDVSNLDLDAIVFILHKEVHVYPDEELKPPLGQGLNRKAQVTLDKVWPVDKTSREVIQSPQKLSKMNYQEMLERACRRLGARFVEYRPQTGSWVFKVDHFSKYGLEESDEEQENAAATQSNRRLLLQQSEKVSTLLASKPLQPLKEVIASNKKETLTKAAALFDSDMEREKLNVMRASSLFADDDTDPKCNYTSIGYEEERQMSRVNVTKRRHVILERREPTVPTTPLVNKNKRGLGGIEEASNGKSSSNKTLLSTVLAESFGLFDGSKTTLAKSKSSILTDEKQLSRGEATDFNDKSYLEEGYQSYTQLLPSNKAQTSGRPNTTARTENTHGMQRLLIECLPLEKSLFTRAKSRNIGMADHAFMISRSFRVGWAARGVSTTLHSVANNLGAIQVNCLQLNDQSEAKSKSLINWLEVNLRHSSVVNELSSLSENENEDPQPTLIQVDGGIETLEAHVLEANRQLQEETATVEASVFKKEMASVMMLCNALWGRLDDDPEEHGDDKEASTSKASHYAMMARKKRFSNWLSSRIQSEEKTSHKAGVTKIGDNRDIEYPSSSFDSVFSFLSSNQVMEACQLARKANNPYLSLLIAVHQESKTRDLLGRQIQRWQEVQAHHYMHDTLLKIYAALSAESEYVTSNDQLRHVADNLEWKRALGMFLWYITPAEASLSKAVALYHKDLHRLQHAPMPDYDKEAKNNDIPFDLKYQLLQLYCDRSHSLSSLLDTRTHTSDPLDLAMSWLVHQCLEAIGYNHLEERKRDALHSNFASQLEQLGLWTWAVYVFMHVSNPGARRQAVVETIARQKRGLNEDQRDFLRVKLAIPEEWLQEALNVGLSNEATLAVKEKTLEQMLAVMDQDEDEDEDAMSIQT